MVEHVAAQQDLAVAPGERLEVDDGGGEAGGAVQILEVGRRDEEAAAAVAHDEAGDRRIALSVADAHDQVVELADHLAGLALDRPVDDGCEEQHRLPPRPPRRARRGQEAAGRRPCQDRRVGSRRLSLARAARAVI